MRPSSLYHFKLAAAIILLLIIALNMLALLHVPEPSSVSEKSHGQRSEKDIKQNDRDIDLEVKHIEKEKKEVELKQNDRDINSEAKHVENKKKEVESVIKHKDPVTETKKIEKKVEKEMHSTNITDGLLVTDMVLLFILF